MAAKERRRVERPSREPDYNWNNNIYFWWEEFVVDIDGDTLPIVFKDGRIAYTWSSVGASRFRVEIHEEWKNWKAQREVIKAIIEE